MPTFLSLLAGKITLSEALRKDDNILFNLSFPEKRVDFYLHLYKRRDIIEALVAQHLRLPKHVCSVGEIKEWIHGSFNLCIPVYVDKSAKSGVRRAIIRFPLPYKLGEAQYPGNAEEKLRCEVATYIWIQRNCPTVPIPKLFAFGFPNGQSFTALENAPLLARLRWYCRTTASWALGSPLPSPYINYKPHQGLEDGYMIVEYVEDGKMLSNTWNTHRKDQTRRDNLFRDLSRIILSLGGVALPAVASWTIDDDGILSLTNRPLSLALHQLENECIPTTLARNLTYSAADPYYLDLLACHDNIIRYKPNAIRDKDDGQAQLSALTMMKALLPHFMDRDFRWGPFVLTLTDLHQSNIFVDDNWHITKLIDLEWACALPMEMLHPPYWLTSQSIDTLQGEQLEEYASVRNEFMDIFEAEERSLGKVNTSLTQAMSRGWKFGSFWYFSALSNPKGLYNLFFEKIQPLFAKCGGKAYIDFEEVVAPYWAADASMVINSKIKEREAYIGKLRQLFAESPESDVIKLDNETDGNVEATDEGNGMRRDSSITAVET